MSAMIEKNGICLIPSVEIASSFLPRMKGLMGRPSLARGCALWITSCGSVHTCFMRFNLDVAFLDCEGRVVKTARDVPPFRMVFGGLSAMTTVEVASGWLSTDAFLPNDIVTLCRGDCLR